MADLSNGYTKVANEIQQLNPRLRLSGREWQCFESVIWLTYGWNKKQDRVTNTVIAELTGLSQKFLLGKIVVFSQSSRCFHCLILCCKTDTLDPTMTEEGEQKLQQVLDEDAYDLLLHPQKLKIRFRLEFFLRNR